MLLDLGRLKQAGIRGRIAGSARGELALADGRIVMLDRVTRGRVVNGTYEAGDLVLRRGVSEAEWRGGVVRCEGTEVYVESTDGFEWVHEDSLEAVDGSRGLNARAHVSSDSEGTAA